MVENLPASSGRNQSSVVHLRKAVTETAIVERARKRREAEDTQHLADFAKARADTADKERVFGAANNASNWKALMSLFRADSRDELVFLLDFSKDDIAMKVSQAIEKLKLNVAAQYFRRKSQ